MKKTIITSSILIASFMMINPTKAGVAYFGKSEKETVRREITRNIACPDFITENSPINQVKAIVRVDENGRVSVDEINSANAQLSDYMVSLLQNMKLKKVTSPEKFVLVVKFEVD